MSDKIKDEIYFEGDERLFPTKIFVQESLYL